jgi:hypothetical protein
MAEKEVTHECPGPDCKVRVGRGTLMCRGHWRQVPRPLQAEVTASWAGGRGLLTDRYWQARQAAIEAVTP